MVKQNLVFNKKSDCKSARVKEAGESKIQYASKQYYRHLITICLNCAISRFTNR